jgi:hypothetical protein
VQQQKGRGGENLREVNRRPPFLFWRIEAWIWLERKETLELREGWVRREASTNFVRSRIGFQLLVLVSIFCIRRWRQALRPPLEMRVEVSHEINQCLGIGPAGALLRVLTLGSSRHILSPHPALAGRPPGVS